MNLIEDAKSVLEDANCFLNQISTSEYTKPLQLLSFSTIGQHTRHFIEFFQCMILQSKGKSINYCKRSRDLRIESNPNIALETIQWIKQQLQEIDLSKGIKLHTDTACTTGIASNISRELHYNIEHTIHHLALIKIGLKIQCPTLQLPERFGVAASTIKHQNTLLQTN